MVNVRAFLSDHEKAVRERIAALRAELVPLERELFEIGLAKSALERGPQQSEQTQLLFHSANSAKEVSSHVDTWRNFVVHRVGQPKSPYARLTIKELIRKALFEQFEDGATANQLLDLFASAWGRTDIVRTSLSPQLSRLKQEGALFRDGQVWRLSAAHKPQFQDTATGQ